MEILDQPNQQEGKSLETVLSEGYSFDLGAYLTEGFKLFGKEAGPYIGFFFVSIIISFAVGMIPFIGGIAGLFINPAIMAGWYIFTRKSVLNDQPNFGHFFDGFKSPGWMQLVLGNFIISIFSGLVAAIIVVPAMLFFGLDMISELSSVNEMSDPEEMRDFMLTFFTGKIVLVILLAVIAGSMIYVLYILTPLFIVFRGMGFWEAMEASRKVVSKQYVQWLLFLLVLIILLVIGTFLCCLGLIVALPVLYLAVFAAYRNIMGIGEAVSNEL